MQAEEGPQKVGRPRIINYSRKEKGQRNLLQSIQTALNGSINGSIYGGIHAPIQVPANQKPLPSIELNAEEGAEA
jgi:hypothetical protein